MSTSKERRYAINYILKLAGDVPCELLHHKKKHKHSCDELCGAEYHRDRQLYLIEEILNTIKKRD